MKLTEREAYTRHSVTLDAKVVKRAQKHDINVSRVCREALTVAVRAAETKKSQSLVLEP